LKVLILTTKTNHHLYFLHQLSLDRRLDLLSVFEKKSIKFNFKTEHKLDNLRNSYEYSILSKNKIKYSSLSKKKEVWDINSKTSINLIKKFNPEIIISYGVGKIREEFLNNFQKKTFNLHGGNPEYYRGLDSFLWAIYHKDFKNFYVTLHEVNKTFDSGGVIYKKKLIFNRKTNICNLRLISTDICLLLSKRIIKKFLSQKKYKVKSQIKKGRYYSAMPSVLKQNCINNFNNYIKNKYGI
jgi:methionyl-tRNA formyltransferase